MKRLIILISHAGTGSNLHAIIEAIKAKKLKAEILTVISDNKDAMGVMVARSAGINTAVTTSPSELLPLLSTAHPDFIILTGWRQIIPKEVLTLFPGKIINLHPGLIPETKDSVVKNPDGTTGLWNKGKYAKAAVAQFLENKATYAGSSVHLLGDDVDFGPVLGRSFEKTRPSDTIDSLYARLKKKENTLYIKVLQKLCNTDESS
ncbi:MAG: hypothetical protein RLZZ455_809 [Candidatus Parcubacteria bacterium]|jgi:phosphoribosylglycinamide formyltransferase-1